MCVRVGACRGAGWAVIGETTKWVPVNNARITNIAYDTTSVTVTAAGVNGEALTVCYGRVWACVGMCVGQRVYWRW